MKRADNKGISANRYKELLGKKLKESVNKDQLINFELLEWKK